MTVTYRRKLIEVALPLEAINVASAREKSIRHLYPKFEITAAMAKERPDLKPLVGQKLTVIAWLWARTVKSPNPAFRKVDVPLVSSFVFTPMAGKETSAEPVIEEGGAESGTGEGAGSAGPKPMTE